MRGELLLLVVVDYVSLFFCLRKFTSGRRPAFVVCNKLVASFAAQRRRELKSEVRRLRVRHRANGKLHRGVQHGAPWASTITKCHSSYLYMFRFLKVFTIEITHSEISRVFDLILDIFCTFMFIRSYVCLPPHFFVVVVIYLGCKRTFDFARCYGCCDCVSPASGSSYVRRWKGREGAE